MQPFVAEQFGSLVHHPPCCAWKGVTHAGKKGSESNSMGPQKAVLAAQAHAVHAELRAADTPPPYLPAVATCRVLTLLIASLPLPCSLPCPALPCPSHLQPAHTCSPPCCLPTHVPLPDILGTSTRHSWVYEASRCWRCLHPLPLLLPALLFPAPHPLPSTSARSPPCCMCQIWWTLRSLTLLALPALAPISAPCLALPCCSTPTARSPPCLCLPPDMVGAMQPHAAGAAAAGV